VAVLTNVTKKELAEGGMLDTYDMTKHASNLMCSYGACYRHPSVEEMIVKY
jgi:hypothetical protein